MAGEHISIPVETDMFDVMSVFDICDLDTGSGKYRLCKDFKYTKREVFEGIIENQDMNKYIMGTDFRRLRIKVSDTIEDIESYLDSDYGCDGNTAYTIYDEIDLWEFTKKSILKFIDSISPTDEYMVKYMINVNGSMEEYGDKISQYFMSYILRRYIPAEADGYDYNYVYKTGRYYMEVEDRKLRIDDFPRHLTLFEVTSGANTIGREYMDALPKDTRNMMLKLAIDVYDFTSNYIDGYNRRISNMINIFKDDPIVDELGEDDRRKLVDIYMNDMSN